MVRPRSPHLLALITVPLSVKRVGGRGKVIRGENRANAGHGQRFACVNVFYACVRHGAEEQFAEQHAFGAKVLGVFRSAGDFRVEIGSRIILADEFVARPVLTLGILLRAFRHQAWLAFLRFSAPRIMASRILL